MTTNKYCNAFFCTLLALLFFACSGADPIIYEFNWQVQAFQNKKTNSLSERLMIQLLADDDDGFNEIYEIFIINDEAQMYWRITSDEWQLFTIDTLNWINISTVYTNNYQKIPRGKYRLLLRDLSGYEDEKTFVIINKDFEYSTQDIPNLVNIGTNTFSPSFSTEIANGPSTGRLLQLIHPPQPKEDSQISSWQTNIASLGTNGKLYTISDTKNINFLSKNGRKIQFQSYLHAFKNSHFILSSGPYNIQTQ